MNRLASVLEALAAPGQDRVALLAGYLATTPEALALFQNPPPRLISPAQLRDWVAEASQLPDWLIEASCAATGDRAEALALIMPNPTRSNEPTLSEVLGDLATLPPGPLARAAILTTAARLNPPARSLYFRLVTGSFRSPVSAAFLADALARIAGRAPRSALEHTIHAVMTHAETALRSGARGPEVTLAVRHGNALVPITRAMAVLPDSQTALLMTWIRAEATARFGPLRAVPPTQVFSVRFSAVLANRRRKSGLTLVEACITAWHPELDPSQATELGALSALLQDTP